MTPTDVFELLNEAFPGAVRSTPLGIEWGPLRVERGSGIAGRGDIWAITFPGKPELDPICGLRSKRALRAALRALIIDAVERGEAVRRALARPEIVDRRCGAAGVDDDGHCVRCGLFPDDDGAECPPGFFKE